MNKPYKTNNYSIGNLIFRGEKEAEKVVARLNDDELVSCPIECDLPADISCIKINPTFWRAISLEKGRKPGSQTTTLWKNFLQTNNQNYAFLIQHLTYGQTSRAHYHQLPEYLFQLAGNSQLLAYNYEDPRDAQVFSLNPSEGVVIPANFGHVLIGGQSDSVTIPIKQTNKRRSDHNYPQIPKNIENLLSTILRTI